MNLAKLHKFLSVLQEIAFGCVDVSHSPCGRGKFGVGLNRIKARFHTGGHAHCVLCPLTQTFGPFLLAIFLLQISMTKLVNIMIEWYCKYMSMDLTTAWCKFISAPRMLDF